MIYANICLFFVPVTFVIALQRRKKTYPLAKIRGLLYGEDPYEVINEESERYDFIVKFKASGATALDNTIVSGKAVKRFVNGQLVIEKNGKSSTAVGAEIK